MKNFRVKQNRVKEPKKYVDQHLWFEVNVGPKLFMLDQEIETHTYQDQVRKEAIAVLTNLMGKQILHEFSKLTEIQRKYMYEYLWKGKTYDQIASEQGVRFMQVYSAIQPQTCYKKGQKPTAIGGGIKKIQKLLKSNYVFLELKKELELIVYNDCEDTIAKYYNIDLDEID
jgi:hypothetical protein